MSSFDLDKSYVVYSGRRSGIYSSWIDCFVQVDRFKGSACEVFNTHGQALSAWEALRLLRNVNLNEEATVRMLTMIGSKKYASDYVSWVASQPCIAQWNMQMCLRQACHILRMGDARYTRLDVKQIEGKTYYKFMLSLKNIIRDFMMF